LQLEQELQSFTYIMSVKEAQKRDKATSSKPLVARLL
jgi:hypothetical protein